MRIELTLWFFFKWSVFILSINIGRSMLNTSWYYFCFITLLYVWSIQLCWKKHSENVHALYKWKLFTHMCCISLEGFFSSTNNFFFIVFSDNSLTLNFLEALKSGTPKFVVLCLSLICDYQTTLCLGPQTMVGAL